MTYSRKLKPLLEADVRDACLRYAKKHKAVLHKRMHFGYGAARGWPDDLFVFPRGLHWWVEFKRPGGKTTKLQEDTHNTMLAQNMRVSVIDNFKAFEAEFDFLLALAIRRVTNKPPRKPDLNRIDVV